MSFCILAKITKILNVIFHSLARSTQHEKAEENFLAKRRKIYYNNSLRKPIQVRLDEQKVRVRRIEIIEMQSLFMRRKL